MRISLCMIVKNEETVIGRCLDSVKGIFDEIIIVDTGSVDKTKEICKKYTEKIYDFIWNDDFSAARNFAFSKGNCDYLCWLDADDIIENEDAMKIIDMKQKLNQADTFMMKYVVSENNDGTSNFEFYRERIVKNCSKAVFHGFIHECIVPFGKIEYCDIKIKHRKLKIGDPERNLKIYLKHKAKGTPFDARSTYYFAKEYFYLKKYNECKRLLYEFLSMKNKYVADVKDSLITLYRCSYFSGNPSPEYLYSVLKEVGGDAETLTLLGEYYFDRKDYKRAETFLKFALCVDEDISVGFVFKPYYHLYPTIDLLKLYDETKDYDKFTKLLSAAKERYPEINVYSEKNIL